MQSTDERAIRDLVADWLAATSAGNLPKVLSLMAEDVVFLIPGQPPMRGRDAFAAAFQAGLPHVQIEGKADIQEIRVEGGFAWMWNHLSLTVTPRNGGAPMRRSGDTLTIFRREPEGRWVLIRDANMLTVEPAASA